MAENTNAGTDQPNQYMIEPICDVTATLGSKVGPSGGMYDNTLRIADEINVDRDYVQNSIVRKLQPATPQNDTAKLLIDTLDYQFIRIDLRTANADKGAVALVRWIRSG